MVAAVEEQVVAEVVARTAALPLKDLEEGSSARVASRFRGLGRRWRRVRMGR